MLGKAFKMHSKLNKKLLSFGSADSPSRAEYIAAGIILILLFFMFNHDDILETANHTWLLLEDIFSGNFFEFYTRTLAHENPLYYVNAAHYNILVYIVFGVWVLPLYTVCKIFALTPAPLLLTLWCKALCCLFAVGCAFITYRLAKKLGISEGGAKWSGLLFLMSPFTLFAAFCMGQYDSLCLFFTLLSLLFYFEKRYTAFSFIMGAAIVCKFFALFLFIPLLLLAHKRILKVLKYSAISLWAYIPTSLLFLNRGGDMGVFNKIIAERLFTSSIDGGSAQIPVFLVLYCLICAASYFYHPVDETALNKGALYVCLCVYSMLFLFVLWHPQWLILLVPFMVLTTMTSSNKMPWWVAETVLFIGFALLSYTIFEGQLEVNMIKSSAFGALISLGSIEGSRTLSFYFNLIPFSNQLASVLFAAPLVVGIALKIPFSKGIPADALSNKTYFAPSARAGVWGIFIFGFCAFFLIPCIFQLIKCL